jgi:hypothetical protein
MSMDIDPKRTGVKATMIPWTEPPMYLENGRWHGPPGAFIERVTHDPWRLCCPGCGELGSPSEGSNWTVAGGSWEDVSTLTLSPWITKSCCGWHGFLRHGVFESC